MSGTTQEDLPSETTSSACGLGLVPDRFLDASAASQSPCPCARRVGSCKAPKS